VKEANADLPYIQLKGVLKNAVVKVIKRKKYLVAKFEDDSGSIDLVWFQGMKWIAPTLKLNAEYIVFGKPTISTVRLISFILMELATEASKRGGFCDAGGLQFHRKIKNKIFDSKGIAVEKNLQHQ